jgi:peroxiredoxin
MGPAIGQEAPKISTIGLTGELVTLGSAEGKRPLLTFISANYPPCRELAPALRSIGRSERAAAGGGPERG